MDQWMSKRFQESYAIPCGKSHAAIWLNANLLEFAAIPCDLDQDLVISCVYS